MLTDLTSRLPNRQNVILTLVALLISSAITAEASSPQGRTKPLSKQELIVLLKGDVPSGRIEQLVREKGVAFPMTAATEKEFRAVGASEALLRVLRAAAPRAAAPASRPPSQGTPAREPGESVSGAAASTAVLFIQASAGGAQVYLDDEPVGTTSAAGVLKLPRVPAGEHTVRVSLAGHQDYQEALELRGGETHRVSANLAATGSDGPHTAEPAGIPNPRPGDAYFAALGVVTPEEQPADYTVVDVLEVVPGSPAERAGLRSACTILTLAGRRVTSPQELRRVLSQHRAGDLVEITFNDGSLNHTTQVRLAGNTPAPRNHPPR